MAASFRATAAISFTLLTAANDRATSYELGYYAGDSLRPGLQPFEIKCKRPGVTLRYREAITSMKPPQTVPINREVNTEKLSDVLEGAVDAVAVITIDAHTMGNMPGACRALISMPPTLALTGRQIWRKDLDFAHCRR